MKRTRLEFRAMVTGLCSFVMVGILIAAIPAYARTLGIRSAIVAPGEEVTIPIEISADVLDVVGFQLDLEMAGPQSVGLLLINEISKGTAVTTTSDLDSNPLPPTHQGMRILLPTEIPAVGEPIPEFDGPGVIVDVQFLVPGDAEVGHAFHLDLSNVILAGPENEQIDVTVFDGILTVGAVTVLPDTISAPPEISLSEEVKEEQLIVTVTGSGQPIPGVGLNFSVDDPAVVSVSEETAITGPDGTAAVNVTGLRDGSTFVHISSPGLEEATTAITVSWESPIITSTPPLEAAQGSTYTYDVEAIDPQGQTVTYALLSAPSDMSIESSTGLITWAVPADQPESGNDVTVEARDPDNNTDTQSYSILVTEAAQDADEDGYDSLVDCDDNDRDVNPGMEEVPYNGKDDDCNPDTPDDDIDRDGYPEDTDCDDNNPSVNPGAVEILWNGLDDDCDPATLDYVDNDEDGYVPIQNPHYPNPADCDDNDPDINPGAVEIPLNGIDENCDGSDGLLKPFVVAIDDGARIYYAKSNGDGTFSDYRFIQDIGGYNARAVAMADFNNDGNLDLVVGGGVNGRVDYFLFLNDGTDHFFNQGIVASHAVSGEWAMDMTAEDINNDGCMDFVGGVHSASVIVALGDGNGGFASSVIDLGGYGRGCDVSDFNRDGNVDLVRGRYDDGHVYVYLGNGDGTFGSGLLVGDVGSDPYGVVAADFDNDGLVDIIANDSSGGDPFLFTGDGNGTFIDSGYVETLDNGIRSAYDGYDFDNDGNVDVIVCDDSGRKIWYYPGNGDGTFGTRIQINPSNTKNDVLGNSAPPYRPFGTPYAIIKPPEQTILLGSAAEFDGSESNDNDDGELVSWVWNFGDENTGTGETISHTYDGEDTYNVTLKVTDDDGKSAIGVAKAYVQANPPVANAGGLYVFDETFADHGEYIVTLDGSASTDDFGIVKYEWDFESIFGDTFEGTTLDTSKWIASAGVSQNEKATIAGAGSWGDRYLFSQRDFSREEGLTFQAQVRPVNTSGNQYGMFGLKDTGSNYSYTQMPHAIYFRNGEIRILEDGTTKVTFGSYTRNVEYEIKIVLKAEGASYYLREAGGPLWNLIYNSSYSSLSPLKVGMTINAGTFELDDVNVSLVLEGVNPVGILTEGHYPVTLTVTDLAGQQDSEATTVDVVPSSPPVADPGGPYVADEGSAQEGIWTVTLDGGGSSDDYGIIKYEWVIETSDGSQVERTEVSPTLTYDAVGTYMVTLTVTDNALQTHTAQTTLDIVANDPPVADPGGPYFADETNATGGFWPIAFDGSGSSDVHGIMKYEWDFDASDGIQVDATGVSTSAIYDAEGSYTVTLSVTDHALQTTSAQTTVTIDLSANEPPTADAGGPYNVNEAAAESGWWTVEFDGSQSSDAEGIAKYDWDFGDGSTLTTWGQYRHNFFEAGTRLYGYDVTGASLYVIATEDNTTVQIVNLDNGEVTVSTTLNKYEMSGGLAPGNGIYFKVEANKPVLAYETDLDWSHSTFIPSLEEGPVGREFILYKFGGLGFYVFAVEDTVVRLYHSNGSLVEERSMTAGSYWEVGYRNAVYHVISTGRIAMQNVGGNGYTTVPSTSGGGVGRNFYCATHGNHTGALAIFAYEDADVTVYNLDSSTVLWTQTIPKGGYWWKINVGTRRLRIESTGDIEVWAGDTERLGYNRIIDLGDDISFAGGRDGKEFYLHGLMAGAVIFAPFDNTAVTVNGAFHSLNADEYHRLSGRTFYHVVSTKPIIIQTLGESTGFNNLGTYLGGITEITKVTHKYNAVGDYSATLTVHDHGDRSDSATTTVTVGYSDPPVADAGGPYEFGEEVAKDGKFMVTLNGTGSSDDYGIYAYEWDFGNVFTEGFDGMTLDEERWDASDGVSQDDIITVTGTGTWGERYCFSQKNFEREGENTFTVRVRLPSGVTTKLMWGLKNNSPDFSYTHMPHAIYLNDGTFAIYEDGTDRGDFGSFSKDQWYDLKIVLIPLQGASYYYRPFEETEWTFLYGSHYATRATLFKVGCTVYSGTADMDDVRVETRGVGERVIHAYDALGTYEVTLKVTDHVLQEDSDTTTVTISAGEPPVADAGGPYTGEVHSFIPFDGGGSTDDTNIARYEWDFGDGHTGRGRQPRHFYTEEGTYTVTLTVYDNLLQSDTDETTVTIGTGNAPVAEAGGPYAGGVGGPPAYFDGSGSSDDCGILKYEWDVDGVKLYGMRPVYTYAAAGTYQVTLTVEDGAGQTSTDTAEVEIYANLPPKVICVPWVGRDVKFPHETWNGKEITLKGVVKDADAVNFRWDFGDGTSSPTMNVTDPYDLSVKHTYPDSPHETPFVATLTVWDSSGQSGSDTYNVLVKEKTLDVEVNVGIDEGLWYLHTTQNRSGASGWWRYDYEGYDFYASSIGSALQAFQINTHHETGDPGEDPYVETVSRGMTYLLGILRSKGIGLQTHGDPDTNGNGIGIEGPGIRKPYELGMVMMAFASSGTPLAIAHSGGENILDRFYHDILTDMVDMYAWGQLDSGARTGGWRYSWNDYADNSASQWAALGMEAAEEAFNLVVPGWVKEKNLEWLAFSDDGPRWGYHNYEPPISGGYVACTPSGLAQLAFDDIPATDWRWINSESYMASVWDSWYKNTRNYYALYALAKAFRIAQPYEVSIIGEHTPWSIDWYGDPERGAARTVLDDQKEDGSFGGEGQGTLWVREGPLRTAWGVLILTQTLFVKPPVALVNIEPNPGATGMPVTLDGSDSYHNDHFRSIVRYEWDVDEDGIYDYSDDAPTAMHTYDEAGIYTVTLRVTDDNDPEKTDKASAIVTITEGAHPPVAVPGGPYTTMAGIATTLDGSGSYDIDPGDQIARFGWELDGIYPYDFDDAVGSHPIYVWDAVGTYNVGLKVWDDGVMNDLNHNGEVDEEERLWDIQWTTIEVLVNTSPVADPNGPYEVDEGSELTLDGTGSSDPDGHPLTYAWDLDNDGEYDDATGATPTHTWPDDGTYTIGLKVSDSSSDDTATATVTVDNVAPTAEAGPDQYVDEGATVALSGTAVDPSPVDQLALTYVWDFGDDSAISETQTTEHVYTDDGIYIATLTVEDDDGGSGTDTLTVTVANVAPTVDAGPDATIDEGDTFTSGGSFVDPGTDTWSATVDYGDGSGPEALALNPDKSFSLNHTYADDGVYTVTVAVTDDDGGLGSDTATVTASAVNHPPVANAGGPYTIDEGAELTLDGRASTDPDGDALTYAWDLDNDAEYDDATGVAPAYTWVENGTYPVGLKVSDSQLEHTASTTVTVNNVAPTVEAGPDQTVDEGVNASFSGSFTDPGTLDTHTIEWNFGDEETASGTLTPSHVYKDNGVYTVTLTVTDDDGGVGSDTLTVTVNNVAPSVDAGPDATINEGGAFAGQGSFTDPGDDTWTATVDYGDGSGVQPLTLNPDRTFALNHVYSDSGTFTVTVTVTDDDGGVGTDNAAVTANDLGPTAAFTWTPESQGEGAPVSFTDGCTSSPDIITAWLWDFGGLGTSPEQNPGFTFNDDGTYTVTLTVTDDDGSTDTVSHDVTITDKGPTAALAGDTGLNEGAAGNYDASSSTSSPDTIVSYEWDWDYDGTFDASGDTGPTQGHVWNGGTYTVAVLVTDDDGSTDMATLEVTVSDLGPTAAFAWSPEPQGEGAPVSFTDASTSSPDIITAWLWDFDGLGTSTDQNPSFTFNDNGAYTVTLTVTDNDGSTDTITHDVTITDKGPAANLTGDSVLDEGQAGSYDASGSTSSPDVIVSYEWDWDYDGTFDASGDTGPTQGHVWNGGTYTVAVLVTDDDGSTDMTTLEVTVSDLGPTALLTGDISLDAGTEGNYDASDSTSSPDAIVSYEWDWNYDGTFDASGDTGPTQTHAWANSGAYTVAVRVTDEDGSTDIATLSVTVEVSNYPPVADAGGPYTADEGAEATLDGSASWDPEGDALTYAWDLDNDGEYDDAVGATPTYVWADNGSYPVGLSVSDSLLTDAATATVTVYNVAPSVGPITAPQDPVEVNVEISVSAPFTDPGVLDTHTATWEWGDGLESEGTVDETNGSGTVSGSHVYETPGVYTITVYVTDKDGDTGSAQYRYVVAYDSSGGFVTGGGWIDSLEGAYTPDPSLTGKASFGFVAKYKKGAKTPTGQTEFQFRVADLNFHSGTYDWLVVAGARAKYKGTGTINGDGNFGFMLSAIDGDLLGGGQPDRFRIKIWDKDSGDAVVYDNEIGVSEDGDPTTVIQSGSIVIHKVKK
ncbi:MAG: PKD domain-containing protein [Thermodesulfobacteriota bacterium]|nr:PKD domain-containing protein [Thermodesulfobacteriota bacterium]